MKQIIKDIVLEHSGGLKLTELITELAVHAKFRNVDHLLMELRSIPELSILKYNWTMPGGGIRAKYFIYWKPQ